MFAERVTAESASPWVAEHSSRYRFAARIARGKRVLDLACGSGDGAKALLHAGATRVVCADLSKDAIQKAKHNGIPPASLVRADGCALPFRDASFDVVTSFETLEHVAEGRFLIGEFRRVLCPGGTLLLSTPNASFTKPVGGVPRNPFHVHEYEALELAALLSEHFRRVDLLGQRVSPEYGACPYWENGPASAGKFSTRLLRAMWKVLVRLPRGSGEVLSSVLLRRTLYPRADDFVFDKDALMSGHVLLAVCEP